MSVKRDCLRVVSAIVLSVLLFGCQGPGQAYHRYFMRGTVVGKQGQMVILCIGSADGARVGQILRAYRFEPKPPSESGIPPGGGGTVRYAQEFRRVATGRVRIKRIVDQHFAEAEVIEGHVGVQALVELTDRQ